MVGPDLFTRMQGDNIGYQVLRELVAHTHIPVLNAQGGKGALLSADSHLLHTTGFPPRDWPDEAMNWASLIIYVGFNRGEMDPEKWNKVNIPVIHINHFSATVEREYFPNVEVIGDIGTTLAALLRLARNLKRNWALDPAITQIRNKFAESLQYPGKDLHVNTVFQGIVVNEVSRYMKQFGEDTIVVLDSGFHQIWTRRNMDLDLPQNLISSNILSPVGCGLPITLAVARASALHRKTRKILLVAGDNGFVLNMGEMTILQKLMKDGNDNTLPLKVVVLVWNDHTHAIVEWNQERLFDKHYDLSVINPDLEKLGEAIPGWHGMPEITDRSQIVPSLEAAFAHPEPGVLLSVHIDAEQNKHFTDYLRSELPLRSNTSLPSRRSITHRIVHTSPSLLGGTMN